MTAASPAVIRPRPACEAKRGVAEVAGPERAADDVVDVHVADQPAALGVPDQVAGLILARGPGQVGGEPLGLSGASTHG